MKIDWVAFAASVAFLAAKAAYRKRKDQQLGRLDDLVTAAQLYVAVNAINRVSAEAPKSEGSVVPS